MIKADVDLMSAMNNLIPHMGVRLKAYRYLCLQTRRVLRSELWEEVLRCELRKVWGRENFGGFFGRKELWRVLCCRALHVELPSVEEKMVSGWIAALDATEVFQTKILVQDFETLEVSRVFLTKTPWQNGLDVVPTTIRS